MTIGSHSSVNTKRKEKETHLMKTIELTEVGQLDSDWFWNTDDMEHEYTFHPWMSFVPFDVIRKVNINADMIEELKDGFPTTHYRTKTYVKRNKFIEFFLGEKYEYDFKTTISKDKVTWVKMSSGKTFYVNETIAQIKDMMKGN